MEIGNIRKLSQKGSAVKRNIYVKVTTKEQLDEVIAWNKMDYLLAEFELVDMLYDAHMPYPVYCCFPDVARERYIQSIEMMLKDAQRAKAGVVIRNVDELAMLTACNYQYPVIADSFLYAYNSETLEFYQGEMPGMQFILSDELTDKEIRSLTDAPHFKAGYKQSLDCYIEKIYGHQRLMITNQCVLKDYSGCKDKQKSFRNEKGNSFIASARCSQCYSIIYNGSVTWMMDKLGEIQCSNILIDFTIEGAEDVRAVLRVLTKALANNANIDRPANITNFTRAHHYKGVD